MKNLISDLPSLLVLLLCGAAAANAQGPRPVIRYANALGWSGQESSIFATTDTAGNVYLAGTTTSADFPATVRIANSTTGYPGAYLFVVKIDPSGANLLFSTIIGGAVPEAIALDSSGSVYVAGVQAEAGYPVTAGAYSATGNCFISKLDSAGASLVYSTRLACGGAPNMAGLAVDSNGNVYLTGSSYSGLVTTPGAYRTTGVGAFALKLNSAGSGLVYSTVLPGTASTSSVTPHAIAVDALGAAYIAGSANIQSFQPMPDTLPHEDPGNGPTDDAMVLKLSPDGSAIVFASLFGGTGADFASGVAVGSDGSVYVSGSSQTSTGFGPPLAFPTTPGAADTVTGFPKGFLARLTPAGDAFVFSTFLSGASDAPCLSVTDAGVDVLATFIQRQYTPNVAGAQIMRISPDGTTLINSSMTPTGYGCGQGGANFVVLGSTNSLLGSMPASPNLSHIGSKPNVSFSLIAADDPGAPQFDVNTGELNLIGWRAIDGTFPSVQQVVHATADGQAVAVGATLSVPGNPVKVDQPVTTAPADITVIANQGNYTGELILFAPGTKDGLVMARINMVQSSFSFNVNPKSLQFAAAGAGSSPVSEPVHVSTEVVSDAFGTVLPVPLNYAVDGTPYPGINSPSLPLPSWLSVANSGTTPEDVTFTANAAGLSDGLKSTPVRFMGTGPAFPNFPAPVGYLNVSFRVGPAPPPATPATMTLTPSAFTLRITDPSQQQQSATVHVATSADPMTFTVGELPTWLTASPLTGQTPADVTFIATPPFGNGSYSQELSISTTSSPGPFVQANVDVALPGYVGHLSVQPISYSSAPVLRGIAPGSLFYIQLSRPVLIPDETDPAGAAAFSLAGYSFTANGAPVALIAYQSGQFLAQMPVDAKPGSAAIDAIDSGGTRVATGNVTIQAVVPDFVADPVKPRAQKSDGTIIDATNPVAPGDAVLVHVTGLGAVNPPLATGQTAGANTPSSPVAAVTATIGGKNAQVISAQVSESSPGVTDIWLTTPNLYDGDHYVSVGAMGVFISTRIPIKVKNP